ncbi:hypothetical protein ACFC09_39905 [Streptomyces sp. NPDC056161]|uniref:hypothetical protein n=1 Tax=Streptomyces sp. NPDC056161 TaxID=3345732 RepID=UPI0035E13F9F
MPRAGVLAVVTCGLVTTRFGLRVIGPRARIQAVASWEVASYLVNSALFILAGIQLPPVVRALTSVSLIQATFAALTVSVVVIGTQIAWFYSVPYLVGLLDRPRVWSGTSRTVRPSLSAPRCDGRTDRVSDPSHTGARLSVTFGKKTRYGTPVGVRKPVGGSGSGEKDAAVGVR